MRVIEFDINNEPMGVDNSTQNIGVLSRGTPYSVVTQAGYYTLKTPMGTVVPCSVFKTKIKDLKEFLKMLKSTQHSGSNVEYLIFDNSTDLHAWVFEIEKNKYEK